MSLRLLRCLMICWFALTVAGLESYGCSTAMLQDDSLDLPAAPDAAGNQQQDSKSDPKPDSQSKQESKKESQSKKDSQSQQDSEQDPKPNAKQDAKKGSGQDPKKDSKKTAPMKTAPGQEVPQQEPMKKGEPKPEEVGQISSLKSCELLPPSTRAWLSIPDIDRFESQFNKTQIGKLLEDEAVKPFFEAAKTQLQNFLDEKNLRVGLRVEDILKVRSGEVCIAGVLQDLEGGQPARGSHGLVLLVDVTNNEAKANDILSQLNSELQKKKWWNY